jgi:hypothetical protein
VVPHRWGTRLGVWCKWSCLSTAGGTPPLGYPAGRVVTPASPDRPPREGEAGRPVCVLSSAPLPYKKLYQCDTVRSRFYAIFISNFVGFGPLWLPLGISNRLDEPGRNCLIGQGEESAGLYGRRARAHPSAASSWLTSNPPITATSAGGNDASVASVASIASVAAPERHRQALSVYHPASS